MKRGEGVNWAFDVADTMASCKVAPTTAADHAKETPAYDKTPDTIQSTSDDVNGLKGMPKAYDKASHCAQPDDSFNI